MGWTRSVRVVAITRAVLASAVFAPAVLASAVLAGAVALAASGGFELLSTQEYQSELTARAKPDAAFVTRAADLNAPNIVVVKPDRSIAIQPPVDIEVRFKAAEGATVSVPSLKVRYGFLGLDITHRILEAPGVQVSAAGLSASGARLPSGSHKLVIEIADNYGRTGRQPLEFTVR